MSVGNAANFVDWLKFIGTTFGYSILGGLAAIALFYLALCCLGFTCWGVAAGSSAACCQSGIGDVEAGSCFADCQSAGAGGMACCFNLILFLIGVFTTATLLFIHRINYENTNPS